MKRYSHLIFCAFILFAAGVAAQGLRYERPHIAGYHPLDDKPLAQTQLNAAHPTLLSLNTTLFMDTAIIDFEKRQLTFARSDSLGVVIWYHHYDELNDYLMDRSRYALSRTWFQNGLVKGGVGGSEGTQNLKLEWELPVHYPGWAQRVLGKDPPRLSISGSIRIKMAYEDVNRKESTVSQSQNAGPGFVFEEQNQFTVTGSVGRLININISANSEGDLAMNDPLKNFKIDYRESAPGELEDEIIQEVTAGYTGFDMPGTQLSGYAESHEGLFGIKVTSKFGPLLLTTIASSEQGESQKLSVSNGGGGSGDQSSVKKEDNYIENRYFFLDTAYIRHYNRKYAISGGDFTRQLPQDLEVDSLEVWLSIQEDEKNRIITNEPGRIVRQLHSVNRKEEVEGLFVLLLPERHYHLQPREGWIRFFDSVTVRDNQRIAIRLTTKGGTITKGYDSDSGTYLWELKPEQPYDKLEEDPERFRLMWRNVYDLSGNIQDRTKFRLRVYHIRQDNKDTVKTIDNVYISELLGLTDDAQPIIDRQDIYNFEQGELIIPPYDTSYFGNEPFANPALKDLSDNRIYRFGKNSNLMNSSSGTFVPVFSIESSGSSKQVKFDLGFGVMENTVRVRADGAELKKNIDYYVNAEIGQLELISPRAKAAEKIDIEYQRESLFMPERKLFLGARAEVKLPFISENSLVGLSILYQNTSISQPIPRISQEPFSKLLIDLNTKLDFTPAWMTSLVNTIPLISTEAPSSLQVEFETAHSRMNPNSDKQAYVDDFESCKQIYSLGEGYRSWYAASPPYSRDSLSFRPPAWDAYWFTPVYNDERNRVPRDEVWVPEKGRYYTGLDKYESVLRLHVTPAPADPLLTGRYRKPWAGIMTPIPIGMGDRKRDQYFELLVKCPTKNGKLHVQMGRMREDICISGAPPNGRPDREDTSIIWRENHDPNLDLGLDRLPDKEEQYWVPDGKGGWQPLPYGDLKLGDFRHDPAKDNYRLYDEDNTGNFRYASRLQGDGWAMATEDINNDGTVETSTREQYHEFILDLADSTSPYIDRTAKLDTGGGWRRYRIPLHEIDSSKAGLRNDVGLEPNEWDKIRMVRLIWTDFDTAAANLVKEQQLLLSGMQFVGNQWEALRDEEGKTKIDVSAISSREDSIYHAEIGRTSLIIRQLDETSQPQPEQALRLNFREIASQEEALVQRSFTYQPLDVSSYDSLTLVVYGRTSPGDNEAGPLYDGNLRFVFRFGSDSGTYYEYRRKIMPRWDNHVRVDLKKLSDLKLAWLTRHPAGKIDTMNADSTLRIKAPAGRQPNFANITWVAVGVVNMAGGATAGPYTGEIWVNELKVVGIKRFNGWSSRFSMQTQWADLLGISGNIDYQGGDFRTMTDSKISMGDSRFSGNMSLNTGLDKFMPRDWGVSIPIGGSVSSSLTRPQLRPNTDVYLYENEDNKPDGFFEIVRDVIGERAAVPTKAEHFETRSYGQSFFVDYSKSGNSANPVINFLLERVNTKFQYNLRANQTRRGARPDGGPDYENVDSTRTYSGGVSYDLTPRDPPSWTKWKPFSEKLAEHIPGNFRELEFSLLPTRATMEVANATYTSAVEKRDEPGVVMFKTSRDLTLGHGLQLDFTPVRPIVDISYSLSINRDFPDSDVMGTPGRAFSFVQQHIFNTHANPLWDDYYILENERSRSQKVRLALNPQIFSWLSHSADYTADYTGTLSKRGGEASQEYINAKVSSGMSFNSGLTVSSLLSAAADSTLWGRTAALLKKGCDNVGFSSINFSYSASSDLTNSYLGSTFLSREGVSAADFAAYQFGLGGRSVMDLIRADMDDRNALGGMRYRALRGDAYDLYRTDNRTVSRSMQLSTSLSFAKPIDLRLSSISLGWNEQYSVQQDTTFFDTTWTFPDFGVGIQSSVLDRIKFVNRHAQGMSLSSNFSIKKTLEARSSLGSERVERISYELSPLVAVDGTLKQWPVRFSYQHTLSSDRSKTSASTSKTETKRNGDNFDLNYEIPQAAGVNQRTIKLLSWTFPVRGKTTTGMRFTRDHSITTTGEETTHDESNMSLTPHVSYVFTDNVTGTLEYTGSRIKRNGAITTSNTVALIAEVRF